MAETNQQNYKASTQSRKQKYKDSLSNGEEHLKTKHLKGVKCKIQKANKQFKLVRADLSTNRERISQLFLKRHTHEYQTY